MTSTHRPTVTHRAPAAVLAIASVLAFGPTALGSSGTPTCRPVDLGIHFAGAEGATAMEISRFQFINVSDHACRLDGFPGAAFYDATGRRLPVRVRRGSLEARAPRTVVLAPGARAGFVTTTSAFAPRSGGCATSEFVHFTPPDDDSTLSIRHRLLICARQMVIGPVGQG